MKNKILTFSLMTVVAFSLFSCKSNASSTSQTTTSTSNSSTPVSFTYSDKTYEKSYGTNPDNTETHDYSNSKVKKTDKDLRSDFAMGVDGSMINKIEALGGQYYNQDGKNQDVFSDEDIKMVFNMDKIHLFDELSTERIF